MDPVWYQMYINMGFVGIEKSPYHDDFFQSCVIRKASGILADTDEKWPKTEKINFDDKAMIGLNVNELKWLQFGDPIDEEELNQMYFKLKIYACDYPKLLPESEQLQDGR